MSHPLRIFAAYASLALAFALDVSLPADVAGGLAYIVPLSICLWYDELKHFGRVVGLALGAIVLDLGYVVAVHGWVQSPIVNAAGAMVSMLLLGMLVRRLNAGREREAVARRSSEALLKAILMNAPVLIAVKDREGRFTLVNRYLTTEWGAAGVNLLGRTSLELSPDPELGKKMHARDLALMREGKTVTGIEKFPNKPGNTYFTTRFPVFDSDDEVVGLGGVSLNITELIAARSTIEQQNKVLEESNAELHRIGYMAAHDLQEPLRMMASFGELLQDSLQPSLEGENAEYLRHIVDNAQRGQQQIKDLLTYYRLAGDAERAAVDLSVAVAAAAAAVGVQASGGRVVCERLPDLRGDAAQLQQLFEQLISNAFKFNRSACPTVTVSAAQSTPECLTIAVADNGIGFSSDHVDRVFEIFTRLNDRSCFTGSGIGLAICRRIMELHGGSISAKSNSQGGSTFICTFAQEAQVHATGTDPQ